MPKISVVPTQEVVKIANDQGMLPERYIGGIEKTLIPYELRYKDGNGNFLHDLKITRDDGSSFSIHEVESESEKLPKFIISDYGKKGKAAKRFYAYTNNIDLVRLQNDSDYLYAFSEILFSKERIEEKRQVSLKNNNKEFIYLGGLKYDSSVKGYVKVANSYKQVEKALGKNFSSSVPKTVSEASSETPNLIWPNGKKNKQEKNALIGNITEHLVGLSVEELKSIEKNLGI